MEGTKIYCGNGKSRTGQYGEFYGISICIDDIPSEHITKHTNGKRYVNLTVSKKKEVDQWGKQSQPASSSNQDSGDLPF